VSAGARALPASDPASGCDDDRLARAHLSRVAEPGDRSLPWQSGEEDRTPVQVVAALRRGRGPEVWLARHARLGEPTVELVSTAARRGIRVLVPGDPTWPRGLDDLADLGPRTGPDGGVPACLWLRGELAPQDDAPPAASLVGARACTAYGEHVAEDLAAGLVQRGWTVVSGAAYGIDAAAHRGALAVDGSSPVTVAVLAGGVDRASPAGHEQLLRSVLDRGGAVVAELPPGTRPAAYRFLLRNRLIAAWSRGVVVVEASHRSGALNTARTAADLSRQVAVVPGPVTSTMSAGTNRLLRDGASCVVDADDVAELLGPVGTLPLGLRGSAPATAEAGHGSRVGDEVAHLGPGAVRVWQALGSRRPRDVEQLVVQVGLGHREVASALAVLELDGAVTRSDGGWRRGVARPVRDGVVP